MPDSRSPLPPPYALALIVCDGLHRDPASGKCFILGTFSSLFSTNFPVVHPAMAVYAAVTNGRGTVPMKFVLTDVDEERDPIFTQEMPVEFPDPRLTVELGVHLPNVAFPAPGEYRLMLHAGGEFLMERRIFVIGVMPPPFVADPEPTKAPTGDES